MISVWVLISFVLGLFIGFILSDIKKKNIISFINTTIKNQEKQLSTVLDNLKNSFSSLSIDSLSKVSEELVKISQTKLDGERDIYKKILSNDKSDINNQIEKLNQEIIRLNSNINTSSKEHASQYFKLSTRVQEFDKNSVTLSKYIQKLVNTLSNSQTRGQWGEKVAEDILNVLGFVENINYIKQKTIREFNVRPDYTFLLPKGYKLNMDVKFPLKNYIKYINEEDKNTAKKAIIKDLNLKIKQLSNKNYINKEQNTIDCVIMFIPNESLYSLINQISADILISAMKNKIIICSPYTLFGVLSVVRQSVEYFAIDKSSNEMLNIMIDLRKNWQKFIEKFDLIDKKIIELRKEFDNLRNTRTDKIDKSFSKLEYIKKD